jgi:MFS family permease
VLEPLRHRDFRLLWTGLTVSLLGDGIYLVAIAWQAYDISNSPFALAVVGVAWTLPTVVVLPFSGALSDRIGRRPVYAIGTVSAAAWAFAFFPLLDTGNRAAIVLAVVVALIAHAAMYGPQAAFVAEQFSTRLRYSGASMGYQIAGIFGGALAPIIAVKLVASTGSALSVSLYVLAALLLTGVGLVFAKDHHPKAEPVAPRVMEVAS